MEWTGKQALRAAFDGGHMEPSPAMRRAGAAFCQWARERGVRDVRQLTGSELAQFAAHLRRQTEQGMSIGYAKNQLTSVNVFESLRGDRAVWVNLAPFSDTDGVYGSMLRPRSSAASSIEVLSAGGQVRVAAVALLCRELGLRRKEACLLDLRLAGHQASTLGRINVTAGSKGGRGRGADRWVPAGRDAVRAIELALPAS